MDISKISAEIDSLMAETVRLKNLDDSPWVIVITIIGVAVLMVGAVLAFSKL